MSDLFIPCWFFSEPRLPERVPRFAPDGERNGGQRYPGQNRARVLLQHPQPRFRAKALIDVPPGFIQGGGAPLGVVGIAGHEMHQPAPHQLVRAFLGGLAETAQEGLRRDLQMGALRHPGFQLRQAALQQLVALRMGHDGTEAHMHHAGEDLAGSFGNQEIGEFHQQIAAVVDGVLPGRAQGIVDIFQGEVEIAAVVNPRSIARRRLQFADLALHHQRIEGVILVGVRAGHDVGGTGGGGLPQHLDGLLQTLGSVVQAGQDVAVDVDHGERRGGYSFIRSSLRYRVFRSLPRICAALLLLTPVAASTSRILSSWTSARVSTGLSRDSMEVSASKTVSRSIRPARITRRAMSCCNWRTLPGQVKSCNAWTPESISLASRLYSPLYLLT